MKKTPKNKARARRKHSPARATTNPLSGKPADSQPRTGLKLDALLLLAVIGVALVLRLIYLQQMRTSPMFEFPCMDALFHLDWARAWVTGDTFVEGPYFRAPLYPLFLAGIFKLCGVNLLAPRLVQAGLGALSCGLVFLIGRRVFSRTVGTVAGFAAASYWMLIYFDAELLIPSLIVFLDLLLIYLLLEAWKRPGLMLYGLAGIVLGLSAIARPNVLLFAPAAVVWLLLGYRASWRRAARYVICFTLGCLIPIAPVTVRNYIVGDDLVLIASQGGVNFFIGNNPESDGMTAIVPGTPPGWWEGYYASIDRAEKAVGRSLKASEVSDYYYDQAFEFFRNQPVQALRHLFYKLRLFWNPREISNNLNIYFWTERFTPLVQYLPLGFALVGPLGILGLFLCGGKRRLELFPLSGFVLVYMVSVVLFFCTARYRTPMLGPLLILASWGLLSVVEALRQARWRKLAEQLGVLALAALFVNVLPAPKLPTHTAQDERTLARAYQKRDGIKVELKHYVSAVKDDPNDYSARIDLGTELMKRQRIAEAIEQFQVALTLLNDAQQREAPATVARLYHNLACCLSATGQGDSAIPHFYRALELDPTGHDGLVQARLGTELLQLGRTQEAVGMLQQAVERAPGHQDTRFNLARALLWEKRWGEAASHFEQLLNLNPNDSEAWHQLGLARIGQGLWDEAILALKHSLQLRPGNPQTQAELSDAHLQLGQYAEALEVLHLAGDSNEEAIVTRQAWLLATCPLDTLRNGIRALEHARRLCPDQDTCPPEHRRILAAALAANQQYEQAAEVAARSLDQARAGANEALISELEEELALYQAGKPYRLPLPSP